MRSFLFSSCTLFSLTPFIQSVVSKKAMNRLSQMKRRQNRVGLGTTIGCSIVQEFREFQRFKVVVIIWLSLSALTVCFFFALFSLHLLVYHCFCSCRISSSPWLSCIFSYVPAFQFCGDGNINVMVFRPRRAPIRPVDPKLTTSLRRCCDVRTLSLPLSGQLRTH